MSLSIFIESKDLDCGYTYSTHISIDSAYRIINARVGESVSLDRENSFAHIGNATINVRSGGKGGTSAMDKEDVLRQINAQL